MGRTLDELRAWLEEPLERGYLEISLVGDLEIERAIALVGRTLGALPARASAKPALAERRVVAFPKGAKEKVLTYRSEIAKGAVALCWPGPDIWDIRRVRRLNVLMSILDDRLRVKVREEMGEAYSVGAVAIPSDTYRGYGVILAQAFADPSRIQQVARVMADIAATLHRGGVTGDELDRALRPTLEMIDKQRRTNRYWIGQVLASSQEYPQRLDWARTMVADHRAIRREEIDALARQYLAPERAVRILCRAEQPRPAGRAVPVQQDAPVTTP